MSKKAKSKTARERLTSLLGDFPQGFNAGMLAGIPGWAGDIGYLLQEYPRALLTDTPLRPPVEYAGTTDSIAKAAGYEIPGTISGQLGAAVGGLLSPGPGDLAAFSKLPAMFLGVKAATANQDALTLAKTLEKAGATRDEIWKATGELGQPWMKGPDGEWRFEISDVGAGIDHAPLVYGPDGYEAGLSEVMRHPQLAEAYKFNERFTMPVSAETGGTYGLNQLDVSISPETKESLDIIAGANLPASEFGSVFEADEKSVFLHELQHAVQQREGFARGGSPGEFASGPMFSRKAIELASDLSQYLTGGLGSKPAEIVAAVKYGDPTELATIVNRHGFESVDDALRFLSAEDVKRTPFGQYERLAGEAEARNVQSRMNMSLQDRINTPPWMTLDVPEDQLIVRKGLLDGAALSIPFWHGSPHKFDAFDLSKMGTGEGAQAYGWGAYGADARDVADQYRINLAYNPDEMRIGGKQINDYYSQIESRAAQMPPQKAQREYDKLSVIERLMGHATLGDAEKYADEVGVGDWFRKEVAPSYSTFGNLYRGEYAWPDPAKEAATPLTGEDLLQWDKPLSEQGGVEAFVELPAFARPLDATEAENVTGQRLYQRLANKLGDDEAAKVLKEAGIPGIRYLDGMSRDGGSGTYNYVMFDDKGIKLLERNGKPIRGLLNP